MKKPIKPCQIKLSDADVKRAVELLLNEHQLIDYLAVTSVKKTRSKNYCLIAEFK